VTWTDHKHNLRDRLATAGQTYFFSRINRRGVFFISKKDVSDSLMFIDFSSIFIRIYT
jgi:hypothetical protein